MDALDKMIADKRAERTGLAEQVRLLDAEIAALETAARLRPVMAAHAPISTERAPASTRRGGGGRRPGDISMQWRAILSDIHELGGVDSYDRIAEIAATHGTKLAISSVRDRVRNLLATGLIEGAVGNGFRVTSTAVERFGFTKETASPEGEADTGGAPPPSADQSKPRTGVFD
jgi:hypothetical protein